MMSIVLQLLHFLPTETPEEPLVKLCLIRKLRTCFVITAKYLACNRVVCAILTGEQCGAQEVSASCKRGGRPAESCRPGSDA